MILCTMFWKIKIPCSIRREAVRGGTGCISIKRACSRKNNSFCAFRRETTGLAFIVHRKDSTFREGVWLHRLRFVIGNKTDVPLFISRAISITNPYSTQ